jgi:hypothetical protein
MLSDDLSRTFGAKRLLLEEPTNNAIQTFIKISRNWCLHQHITQKQLTNCPTIFYSNKAQSYLSEISYYMTKWSDTLADHDR